MQIDVFTISCQGGRDYNEDNVRHLQSGDAFVAVVADGLGGHGGGSDASFIVAEEITDAFVREPQLEQGHLLAIFEKANAVVTDAQSPTNQMKSTGVGLFLKGQTVAWGHAGDSRLYHFINGLLQFQTLDHSVSQMAVFAGEITADQIRHHDDRNRVMKAFGLSEGFKAEIAPACLLESGFHAFLLCTDGFWEYVLEPEMEADLQESKSPEAWLNAMLQRLEQRAPENNDNYTAAAIFVNIP
jgi:serine/threonine protein phosphatase PrpC